mgnify:CR=1 FL=1
MRITVMRIAIMTSNHIPCSMKFYNRTKELELLRKTEKKSHNNAQMTIVIGRRRIGKTTLLIESAKNHPHLYFFISRKNEVLLCEEFIEEIVNIYEHEGRFTDKGL